MSEVLNKIIGLILLALIVLGLSRCVSEKTKTDSSSFSLIHVRSINPRAVEVSAERLKCFPKGLIEGKFITFTCLILPPEPSLPKEIK